MFKDYIKINGLKYKTVKDWLPRVEVPATRRITLDGSLEAVYGTVDILRWEGRIIAPLSSSEGWGNFAQLSAAIRAHAAAAFEDHYETPYTVLFEGPFDQISLQNVWNVPSNKFYVTVKMMGVE